MPRAAHAHFSSLSSFSALTVFMLAGCGGNEGNGSSRVEAVDPGVYEGEAQRRGYDDRRGDVRALAVPGRPPTQDALDLERVSLRRKGETLSLSFATASPASPPMNQTLRVFERRGVLKDIVEIRYPANGPVSAWLRPAEGPGRRLQPSIEGSVARVDIPLTKLMKRGRFKWQAGTSTRREIVDRVPDGASSFGFFPSRR